MTLTKVYDEIVDFIAAGGDSQSICEFHPFETTKAHVMELIARAKDGTITAEETSDLEHYKQLEHIMRLAKARLKRLHWFLFAAETVKN